LTSAGEIPGLPAGLPPFVERDFELNFSNDFLGRGGGVDDFRTQQLILMARLGDHWMTVIDHSILTLHDATAAGRTDQLAASIGYHVIDDIGEDFSSSVAIGAGLRSTGNYAGESMQNGFHRLIGSDIERLPYTITSETAATVWIDAERYKALYESRGTGGIDSWRVGYWLRANSLLTSKGQWDGSVAAYAVASRKYIDLWVGLRQDGRSGYEDPVLRETAMAEQDLSVVIGARFGALVIETVQQTGNDASYGQIRLVSPGSGPVPRAARSPRYGIDFGFLLPDVQLRLGVRKETNWENTRGPAWPSAFIVDIRYGEPQYENNTEAFVQSSQIGLAFEWVKSLGETTNGLSTYGNIGTGWRNEKILGAGSLEGETSASIGRAVLTSGVGLRFDAAQLGPNWRFRIQSGISAWMPVSDANAEVEGSNFTIQKPGVGAFLGMTFDLQ
jgi:hypothetical protein